MPVDRKARDEMAGALVAYLGGYITAHEFEDRCLDVRTPDVSAKRVVDALWYYYDDLTDHRASMPLEAWDYHLRLLTFLRTDLQLEPLVTPRMRRYRVWTMIVLVCLAAAIATGVALHRTIIAYAAWAMVALIGWFLVWLSQRCTAEEEALIRLAPFRDEAQWRRYSKLIDQENLPAYYPAVHHRPIRDALTEGALRTLSISTSLLWMPFVLLIRLWTGDMYLIATQTPADDTEKARATRE